MDNSVALAFTCSLPSVMRPAAWSTPPISLAISAVACEVSATRLLASSHADGGFRDVPRDVLRHRGLFFDGGGDRRYDVADFVNDHRHFVDLGNPAGGGRLHARDLALDVLGGGRGLLGQFLDLVSHHRETFARRTRAGGFDGGVERQQIGLRRNFGNGFGDFTDQLRRCAQLDSFVH